MVKMQKEWLEEEDLCDIPKRLVMEAKGNVRRNNGGTTWLTCDEVVFVQRLGTHRDDSLKRSRAAWLQLYLEAAKLPKDWGKIDKAAVVKEATRLLRAEQRKAGKKAA